MRGVALGSPPLVPEERAEPRQEAQPAAGWRQAPAPLHSPAGVGALGPGPAPCPARAAGGGGAQRIRGGATDAVAVLTPPPGRSGPVASERPAAEGGGAVGGGLRSAAVDAGHPCRRREHSQACRAARNQAQTCWRVFSQYPCASSSGGQESPSSAGRSHSGLPGPGDWAPSPPA